MIIKALTLELLWLYFLLLKQIDLHWYRYWKKVRETSSSVKAFKNFKEKHSLRPDFAAEGIFGGLLLGIKGAGTLSFFAWDTLQLVRRIDINCKVCWRKLELGHTFHCFASVVQVKNGKREIRDSVKIQHKTLAFGILVNCIIDNFVLEGSTHIFDAIFTFICS